MAGSSQRSNDGKRIEPFQQHSVSGFLHHAAAGSQPLAGSGLVLTHGAGGNCQSELLLAVAETFVQAGVVVLRCDLPFIQGRRGGPPRPGEAKLDQAGLREAASLLRKRVRGKVFLGGHSYGGRQASILLADDVEAADALLLLSYPLHPPNKPQQLRTTHWPSLRTPALFVHGSKDPFGSAEEMQTAMRLLRGDFRMMSIDGAGHDLKRGRFDLQQSVVRPMEELLSA